jgi:hypothetical protein
MNEDQRRVEKAQRDLDAFQRRQKQETMKRARAILAVLDPKHYGPRGRKKAPVSKEATPLEHVKLTDALECLVSAVESRGLPSSFGKTAHITFSSADAKAFTKLAKKLTLAIAPPEEASE